MASKTLMRKLDINITGEQAHSIKCKTWSYKKRKKKKKKKNTKHNILFTIFRDKESIVC